MIGAPENRFWNKVDRGGKCWIWTASTNSEGYGNFWVDGRLVKAHRFSYELVRGKIKDGFQLDHLCRVRACVNPNHLETVTSAVNTMRGESIQAKNARKTHCVRGHSEWRIRNRGTRYCGACCREDGRKYYADPSKRDKKLEGQRARRRHEG